jgi:hypothetical protein
LTWLALVLTVAVSADVVEDIVFEMPDLLIGSEPLPVSGLEDSTPDVWIISSTGHGQVSELVVHASSIMPTLPVIFVPPYGVPWVSIRQTITAHPHSLSLPPLRI